MTFVSRNQETLLETSIVRKDNMEYFHYSPKVKQKNLASPV